MHACAHPGSDRDEAGGVGVIGRQLRDAQEVIVDASDQERRPVILLENSHVIAVHAVRLECAHPCVGACDLLGHRHSHGWVAEPGRVGVKQQHKLAVCCIVQDLRGASSHLSVFRCDQRGLACASTKSPLDVTVTGPF